MYNKDTVVVVITRASYEADFSAVSYQPVTRSGEKIKRIHPTVETSMWFDWF